MPCIHIQPAMVSIALWRPTSSTNISISAPRNSAQPCTEPALRWMLSCWRMTSSMPCSVRLANACVARIGQLHRIDAVHQAAEHGALAATGGDHALAVLRLEVRDAARVVRTAAAPTSQSTVIDSTCSTRIDQPLVAQVTEHQQFGLRAQGHQRDQLALVDEQRQRPLVGDMDRAPFAVFVEHLDLARQRHAGRVRRGTIAGGDDASGTDIMK